MNCKPSKEKDKNIFKNNRLNEEIQVNLNELLSKKSTRDPPVPSNILPLIKTNGIRSTIQQNIKKQQSSLKIMQINKYTDLKSYTKSSKNQNQYNSILPGKNIKSNVRSKNYIFSASEKNILCDEILALITNYSELCFEISKWDEQKITKSKVIKNHKSSINNEILNLIKKYDIKNVNDFELVFGDNLTTQNFFIILLKIIKNKLTVSNDELKEESDYLDELNFKKILKIILLKDGNEVLTQLKRDFFLSFLYCPFEINSSQLTEIITKISNHKECTGCLFNDKLLNESNFLLNILTSKTAIHCMLKCLKSQNDNLNIDENLLKNEIRKIFPKLGIFRVSFPNGIYGATIINSKIFINKFFYKKNPIRRIQRDAAILITLLHEICHYLLRDLFRDEMTFLNLTRPFWYQDKKFEEIGVYFEYLLTDNNFYYCKRDSEYILDFENWKKGIVYFKKDYLKILTTITDVEKKRALVLKKSYPTRPSCFVRDGLCLMQITRGHDTAL